MSPNFRLALPAFFLGAIVGAGMMNLTRPTREIAAAAEPTVVTPAPANVEAPTQPSAPREYVKVPVDPPEAQPPSAAAPAAESGQQARTALADFLGNVVQQPEGDRQATTRDLIFRLRAAGPAGVAAIKEYFDRGEDVKLGNSMNISGGRVTESPSLRLALLDALADFKGPEAAALSLDILRQTSSMQEAMVAIRNAERAAPGQHRAEAVRAVQELLASPDSGSTGPFANGSRGAIDLLRYYHATELLPALEKRVTREPHQLGELMGAIRDWPAEERRPALQRLLAQPAVAKQLASSSWAMQQFDYGDPSLRATAAQIFSGPMDARNREQLLQSITQLYGGSSFGSMLPAAPTAAKVDRAAEIAQLRSDAQARLTFLDTVAASCTTPVLQQRFQEAREQLQSTLRKKDEDLPRIYRGSGSGSYSIRVQSQ